VLAERGWYCACLNWFGHNGSRALPRAEALRRSMADAAQEIGMVAGWLSRTPVLIGDSMGGIPVLKYAAQHDVVALVLTAPVVPKGFADAEIPVPVDPEQMWLQPDEILAPVFWDSVDEETSARFKSLRSPESPQAVLEATRWLAEVDISGINVPAYLMAGGQDKIVPSRYVESLANSLGAKFELFPDAGHGLVLNPIWREVTAKMGEWLDITLR
jgi:non-heme chloroperoxidase